MNGNLLNSEKEKYFLQPGYIFVSREPHLVSTVLGSCVAVCMWDPVLKFGGMNHYVHSKPFRKQQSAQFGSVSIIHMIRLMIQLGSNKVNLKAHVAGGAQNPEMGSTIIGAENIKVAEKILKDNYIDIVTFDTGGKMGRKVVFDTETGEIVVYKVNNLREYDWYADKSSNN
ncbi:MAG: hypothetical protein A2Y25_03150 [Candidatus Melainabacteria bacterium GWF2_37_15]|nr:MAG: hypothetical protein A2Y25_03150 [Candidatus Melainabacteria bacterium GWF2_37_15]